MPKTKIFRVATEGDTVDGRKIERSWLTDAAATYNRTTYGARVNLEHIRGVTADKPFKAYGDVLSLSTEEIELEIGGKKQKRLALNAEIEATDDLVAMNRDKQKLYTSIEISPNFANTGKAYLVGLAVTDSPASLGTEVLSFAVQHPDAIRHGPKKQHADNVFSTGLETSFELAEGETAPPVSEAAGMIAAATAFFKSFTGQAPAKPDPVTPPANPGDAANDNDPRFTAIGSGLERMTAGIEAMAREFTSKVTALSGRFDTLEAAIEKTDGNPQRRAPADGRGNFAKADF